MNNTPENVESPGVWTQEELDRAAERAQELRKVMVVFDDGRTPENVEEPTCH